MAYPTHWLISTQVDSLACAKLAGAPVVVAVNKMDVEGADAQRVEGELMSYDLVPESAGGDTLVARVSAKEKTGLDELLEKVLLQADLLDLKANPDRPATGTVIEAGVEKGLGVCATTLVERGTLKVGDVFTAGAAWGKCRALQDEFGNSLEEAGPGYAGATRGLDDGRRPSPLGRATPCRRAGRTHRPEAGGR